MINFISEEEPFVYYFNYLCAVSVPMCHDNIGWRSIVKYRNFILLSATLKDND